MAMEQRRPVVPVHTATGSSPYRGADLAQRQLPDYLDALRRRWWLVACAMIAAGIAAFVLVQVQTKTYKATATLILDNSSPAEVVLQTSGNRSLDPERDVNTSTALVRTSEIAARVKRTLRLRLTVQQLLAEVSAKTRGNSNVLAITAEDPSPQRAARIANAFAREYVHFRRAAARSAYLQAASLARKRLAALSPSTRRSAEGRSLKARLAQLQIAATLQTAGVQPVDPAQIPAEPASKPSRAAAMGAVLGLIVGAALAIVLEFKDRRIKDEDEVEQATALEVVGRIPVPKRSASSADPSWSSPEQAEAFLALAAQLRHRGVGSTLQTVMVASAGTAEGRTSTVLGTGAALARIGYRVIAVEADLRDPALGRRVRLPEVQGAQGLVGLLKGFSALERELVELDPGTGLAPNGKRRDRASFGIVRSGLEVPDPHRLLSSPHLPSVLAALQARADVVIFDTPALSVASDALTLAPFVDTALFVVRLGMSREDLVARGLDELRGVGIDPAGVVVVGD